MTKVLVLGLIITNVFLMIQVKFTSLSEEQLDIERAKVDSLIHLSDSLYMDNYPCQIELNRYQVAYEILAERNPRAAAEYGHIISNETE